MTPLSQTSIYTFPKNPSSQHLNVLTTVSPMRPNRGRRGVRSMSGTVIRTTPSHPCLLVHPRCSSLRRHSRAALTLFLQSPLRAGAIAANADDSAVKASDASLFDVTGWWVFQSGGGSKRECISRLCGPVGIVVECAIFKNVSLYYKSLLMQKGTIHVYKYINVTKP